MAIKTLVTGGCRSGKSTFALEQARDYRKKVFIATATGGDEEMKKRIKVHKKTRGPGWRTLEEPFELSRALKKAGTADFVVIDCLTLWLSNLLCRGDSPKAIEKKVESLAREILKARARVVIVTNEVGSGIVPENELARNFRDLAGLANQRLGQACNQVVLMVAGLPFIVKKGKHEKSW
jgi:adenosyl cobinamide kinase/adenosyl cobinamide phosphate guanylyltransferase